MNFHPLIRTISNSLHITQMNMQGISCQSKMVLFTSLWGFMRIGMCPTESTDPPIFKLSKNIAKNADRYDEENTRDILQHILCFLLVGTIRALGEKVLPPRKRAFVSSMIDNDVAESKSWNHRLWTLHFGLFLTRCRVNEWFLGLCSFRLWWLVQEIVCECAGSPLVRMENE